MSVDAGSVYMDVGFNVPKISRDLEKAVTAAADKVSPAVTKTFDQKLAGISKTAESVGKKVTVGLSLPAAAGLTLATKAATDLQQAVGGTGAVFGRQADKVGAFAKGAADAVGLSEQAARDITTKLGASLTGYGFAVDQAADKSITLTKIGADLAATFGGTTADAVDALGSVLRGEFDPAERFGIALNQTLVDAKAVSLGLAQNTSNVSQNARAQAALALITERSATSQGQFAKEANTAAGAAQIAAAKAANGAADLGQSFLPIYTKISQATGAVATGFTKLPDSAQTGVAGLALVAAGAGPVIYGFGKIGGAVVSLRKSMNEGGLAAGSIGRKFAGLGTAAALGLGAGLAIGQHFADSMHDAQVAASEGFKFDNFAGSTRKLNEMSASIDAQRAKWNDYNIAEKAVHAEEGTNITALENQRDEYAKHIEENRRRILALGQALGITGDDAQKLTDDLKIDPSSVDQAKLLDVLKRVRAGTLSAADATAELAGEQTKAAPTTADLAAKLAEQNKNARSVADGMFSVVDAQKNYTSSVKAVDTAQRAATTAAEKVTDAQRTYEDSTRGVADAQRAYQTAVKGIGDAQRGYQDSLQGVTDAERKRQASLRGVESAQKAVTDAQKALNDALAGPSEDQSISLERAQIALQRAQKAAKGPFDNKLDKESAQLDVRQAQADLVRLQTELAQAVPNAQANLVTAQQGLADAQQASIDAARGVTDAQRAVVDASNAVTDAQRTAADASRGIADAQRGVTDAARGVRDAQREAADATDAVKTAQTDAARAAIDLNSKAGETNQLYRDQAGAMGPAIDLLEQAKQKYPEVAGAMQPFIDQLKAARDLVQKPATPDPGLTDPKMHVLPGGIPRAPGKAAGGSVLADHAYKVTEAGAELFTDGVNQYMIPSVDGRVIPNNKITAGAGTTIVNQFLTMDYNEGLLAAKTERINARQLTGRYR